MGTTGTPAAAAEGQPGSSGAGGTRLSDVFALNREGLNAWRGLIILALFLLTLIVLNLIDEEQYFLSVTFGALFAGLLDPGGSFADRSRRTIEFALIGAAITAFGFWIPSQAWGWVVLASFLVTLVAGLTVKLGTHRFVAAMLLNIWFLIAISVSTASGADDVDIGGQTFAWLVGSALWIVVSLILWLARGRRDSRQTVPEIPGDISPRPLTTPLIAFAVLRASGTTLAVAIAFGFDLPEADWTPIAALVAMQPSLAQTKLVAEQRLAGALIGAVAASVVLLSIDDLHVLEVIMLVVLAIGVSIRSVNYALYTAAIAAGVLIGMGLPDPGDLGAEWRRVLYTLIGVGIGVIVMLLGTSWRSIRRTGLGSRPEPRLGHARPGLTFDRSWHLLPGVQQGATERTFLPIYGAGSTG
jgi:uncharacterized membrane protein YccC